MIKKEHSPEWWAEFTRLIEENAGDSATPEMWEHWRQEQEWTLEGLRKSRREAARRG